MRAALVVNRHDSERRTDAHAHDSNSREQPAHGLPRPSTPTMSRSTGGRAALVAGGERRGWPAQHDRNGLVLPPLPDEDLLIERGPVGQLEVKEVTTGVDGDCLTVQLRG